MKFGMPYSESEILQLAAANTLEGRARSNAIRDLVEIQGRSRCALTVMAGRMRNPDVVLLERCRAAQVPGLAKVAMVPVRKYSPRVKRLLPQPVDLGKTAAHSGGELTVYKTQA